MNNVQTKREREKRMVSQMIALYRRNVLTLAHILPDLFRDRENICLSQNRAHRHIGISLFQMLQSALAACNCVMRRKMLLSFAMSSAGLPSSATWPSANTTILSAASTVRIR